MHSSVHFDVFVFCLFFGGAVLNVVAQSSEGALVIDPKGSVLEKPVGDSFILTCKPQVSDPSLITDFRWLGPDNQTVREETDRKYVRRTGSPEQMQLVFQELRENDTGLYHCYAVYASNNQLTSSVLLKSFMPIRWIDAPEEQYATLGEENEMITCVVQASPAATLSWSKSGQPIATGLSDVRYAVEQGGLRISEVREEDEGTYTCSAAVVSTGEFKVRQIRFKVHSRPEFINQPLNSEGVEGEPLRIECRAKGRPAPNYVWLNKDNANLGLKEGYSVDKEGTLNIDSLKREDAGKMTCVAENAAKNGRVEKSIDLVVVIKPRIEELVNKTQAVGKQMSLVCRAYGSPPPEIIFRKLSRADPFVEGVQPSDARIMMETSLRDGFTVGTLSIGDILRSDDGLYGCTARNKGGEAYVNGHLEVQFPPSFGSMPNIDMYYSWNDNPVNLSCIAESIPNATIRWYYGSNLFEAWKNRQLVIFGEGPQSVLQVTPKDASHYTSYTCRAQNLLGEADYTMTLTEAYPPERIQQAIIVEDGSTADMVTFRFVGPREIKGMEVDAYLVEYRLYDQPWADAKRKMWTRGTPYVLEDLVPRESYAFRFAARNAVGTGDWAADMSHTMPDAGPPFAPVVEKAPIGGTDYDQSPFPDRYELRWQVPPANGLPIDSFELTYFKVIRDQSTGLWTSNGPKHTKNRPYPGASLVMSLTDLEPSTFYKVELKARNAIGYSHPGVTVFRTEDSRSHQPSFGGNGTDEVGVAVNPRRTLHEESQGADTGVVIAIVVVALVIVIIVLVDAYRYRKGSGVIFLVSQKCRRGSIAPKHYTVRNKLSNGSKDEGSPNLRPGDVERGKPDGSHVETSPMLAENGEKDLADDIDTNQARPVGDQGDVPVISRSAVV